MKEFEECLRFRTFYLSKDEIDVAYQIIKNYYNEFREKFPDSECRKSINGIDIISLMVKLQHINEYQKINEIVYDRENKFPQSNDYDKIDNDKNGNPILTKTK